MEHEVTEMEHQAEPETGREFSIGESLSGIHRIFHAPVSLFNDIRDGLPWLPAIAVLILISLGITIFNMPLEHEIEGFTQQLMVERGIGDAAPEVSDEIYTASRMLKSGLKVVIGVPFVVLLTTLFYWLGLLITFGNVKFGRIFSLQIFIMCIAQLSQLMNAIYCRLVPPEFTSFLDLSQSGLNTSLSLLYSGDPEGISGMFARFFLQGIDIFVIWQIALMVIGSAIVLGKSRKVVTVPIVVVALLGIALAAMMGAFGAHFAASAMGG
ncbi:MAG: hypothetical protein GY835_17335 [bacterium]|nr:hypothetical protein [bacterium]